MNKMKVYLLLIFLSSAVCGATAFPLGTYSYLGNKVHVYDNRDDFTSYMQDLGYNTNIIEIFSPNSTAYSSYVDLYEKLSTKGIKAIVMDKRSNEAHSSYGLSIGSYQRFEAEYKDGEAVNLGDNLVSKYWYRSNSDINERVGQLDLFDRDFWLCSKDSVPDGGFAYTDLNYRWNTVNGDSVRIGKEFFIKTLDSPDTSNYLYITYAFNISNIDAELNVSTPLLAFMPCGYRYSNGGHALNPVDLPHEGNSSNGTITYFRLEDFYNSGNSNGIVTHTIKIKYSDMLSDTLFVEGNFQRTLVNLNPRLYWYANCDLKLDYIEFEDQLFHNMKGVDENGNIVLNPVYQGGLTTGISSLFPSVYPDIVSGIYTFDEPRQGQWKSFKMIQDEIPSTLDCMTASYDWQYNTFPLTGTGGSNTMYYSHIDGFRAVAQPNITMPDIYPLRYENNYIDWNNENGLQRVIDNKVVKVYQAAKEYVTGYPDRKFYPVVQAFGYWDRDEWLSWILPPPEMQKMLQYLPLCFDPDGLFNYRLFGYQKCVNNGNIIRRGDYAALFCTKFEQEIRDLENPTDYSIRFGEDGESRSSYTAPEVYNPTYEALKEANAKVLKYADLINGTTPGMVWNGSNVIGLTWNGNTSFLTNMHMSDITVVDVANEPYYQGYIQCGYYQDNMGNPAFMVVNRRANIFESSTYASPRYVPVSQYSSCYPPINGQTLLFGLDPSSYTTYGTFPSLYDPADEQHYISANDEILVGLDPGDGKLLQMCSSLPSLVTSNATLKKTAYLSGVIVIDQGAEVTMMPNTVTRILPNSCIVVTGGSTLNLNGVVDIAAGVSILVEPGSSINFNRAKCTWGIDSYLQVYEAQMNASHTSFAFNPMSELPYGITLSNDSVATLAHVAISGSGGINVLDSDLYVSDIDLVVPANRTGIGISNAPGSHEVHIDNTDSEGSISGIGDGLGRGIYGAPAAGLKLSNVLFANLNMGVELEQSNAVTDSIRGCDFENCVTGISLTGRRCMPKISVCSFVKDGLEAEATGVVIYGAYPTISECTFDELEVGVFAEFTSSTSGRENFMTGNTFYKCLKGIESRGSSYRVNNNVFTLNRTGINMVTGSNMNLGSNALNSLQNTREHLAFMFDQDFYACVQLYNGHNNFHHDPGPEYTEDALDFAFNDHFQIPVDDERFLIDVSGNWFEDGSVLVDPSSYAQYITYSSLDPYPNLMNSYAVLNRMDNALMLEAQGQYQQAVNLYKDILDEGLESEEQYLASAVDGVYRISGVINDPAWDASSYLDAKTVQYAEDIPGLSVLIDEYRVKCRIETGDFQSAINMVEGRISNPRSAVDSLLAVLDLEMVLLLQNSDETKQAVSTKYSQYKYPSMKAFKTKHHEHLEQLYELAGKAEAEIIIPPKPMISRNYPNPFNPSTTIAFSLPTAGKANLNIYNVKGQKVRDLGNPELTRGHHTVVWDGRDNRGQSVSSGVYFVRLSTAQGNSVRKILMLK